jgi:starch phosphorylase
MIFKTFFAQPKFPANLQPLFDLAGNLWTIWNYDALDLFYRVDAQLFRDVSHNPVKFVYSLSKERLEELSGDEGFLFELRNVWDKFQKYIQFPGTMRRGCALECSLEKGQTVAYFSMEYALHESIPIYAGGLGVLAGDFLKCASDLNLPIIGLGLLYKYGYFTQYIDSKGFQSEVYTPLEQHYLPFREIRDDKGRRIYVNLKIASEDIRIKLWEIPVGNKRLILLDTDIEENPTHVRDITNELYTSSREKRFQQELVLGVGGIRALEALNIKPTIYHINEGHAALIIIGRLQSLMAKEGLSFTEAKAVIKASTVMTTHTPVMAGNENFLAGLVEKHLDPILKEFGMSFKQIENYGYLNGQTDKFWQPAFAIHFAKYINGVSKQHMEVSKKMWFDLFPGQPLMEIPITHITNGVHISWLSQSFVNMLNSYVGPDYVLCGNRPEIWNKIYDIPDGVLWEEHRRNKKEMINFVRRHISRQMAAKGYSRFVTRLLNPDFMTIVFARRFASYKRPTLILADKERLKNILTDTNEPVQLIFSGKAHPADESSKKMIKEVIDFARYYHLEDRVIFLENYDMNVARHLQWGADLWLNTPAQNMEASGTSGMKAAMNGALHFSTLEGWWKEGYNGKNGWAVTAGQLYDRPDLQDLADANQFYDFLEHEVTALYYERNEADIPEGWMRMMKESMVSISQNFNMNRVLCDYFTKFYVPAGEEMMKITDNGYKLLKESVAGEKDVVRYFDRIKILSFTTDADTKEHVTKGEKIEARCSIDFQDAPADLCSVELFYMMDGAASFKTLPMKPDSSQRSQVSYTGTFEIEGYGMQSVNVRVRPANQIVRDLHPELVKWKE